MQASESYNSVANLTAQAPRPRLRSPEVLGTFPADFELRRQDDSTFVGVVVGFCKKASEFAQSLARMLLRAVHCGDAVSFSGRDLGSESAAIWYDTVAPFHSGLDY